MRRIFATITACLQWLGVATAGELRTSGWIGIELRGFVVDNPQFADQFDGLQSSVIVNPELRYRTDNGANQFSLIPFLRLDGRDDERTHFDLREAYWNYRGEDWELLAGVNKVFWGVAESRHLVDIINQTDFVEDIDNEDKLGQPMIDLSTQRDWGNLSFFVLPGFRERTFPGGGGRLRLPLPVDEDAAMFESSTEAWHVDYALRYSHVVGNWDIGAYYFYGTGREPRLLPEAGGTRLVPHYDLINQVGVDLQYTREAWLWKFEGIVRQGQGDTFEAVVGGFEYTLFQISDSTADLGLLFEYLYDGRDEDTNKVPVTFFDDDLFFGARLALNDVQDTEVLTGAVIDRDDQSTVLSIEAERRLGDSWNLEFESRWFLNIDDRNPLSSFKDDSFITVRFSRFF